MKKNILLSLLIIIAATCTMLFAGCSKDKQDKKKEMVTYTMYSPIYQNKTEVMASINGVASTSISHAGKLYMQGSFIYLNDVNKGIHIIDNSNASHPIQVAYLAIPGNLDIAIKDHILYADMYNDLLALDITDLHHVKLASTVKNFFTERAYFNGVPTSTDDQIAVDWNEKDTTVEMNTWYYPNYDGGFALANSGVKAASAPGVAGSMASMVLMNNYLYAISERHSLGIVDISDPAAPTHDSSFFAGFDLQTIYPFEDKLFLGSAIGMFMFDVSDPAHPVAAGQFEHGRACDPVVSDGDYAYVTLHSGTECGGDANELDVINVKDIQNSSLVKTYNLTKPTGLSKDGDLLFVCDGTDVKVYNAANPAGLLMLNKIESNEPYDVIAFNKRLIVVTADGLSQYDYSNTSNIRLLSFMAAKK